MRDISFRKLPPDHPCPRCHTFSSPRAFKGYRLSWFHYSPQGRWTSWDLLTLLNLGYDDCSLVMTLQSSNPAQLLLLLFFKDMIEFKHMMSSLLWMFPIIKLRYQFIFNVSRIRTPNILLNNKRIFLLKKW